ncbi:MAG: dienelactone hydrolase family protein [Steroidobacteraceae bacterium]|jgi:carboxymethylenebutenolidase|nr:carboxymethylenebutenolidase [Gammaproteobacteria bacterium]
MRNKDFESQHASLHPLAQLDRRGFVTTALVAGFAAATLPVHAAVITTDAAGLDAGEIKIPVRDGSLPAYAAKPAGGKNLPIVIVIQEIFGVHEHIRDVCRRFAKLGAYAIAPELFARQGNPATVADMPGLMRDIVAKVPDAQVMADLDETVQFARRNGGRGKVGITGFCWGGRITWLYAAHSSEVAAGVAWYGRLVGQGNDLQPKNPIDLVGGLQAPVLGQYGGRDGGIPVESVETLRAAIAKEGSAAAKKSELIVYPEAQHGFFADYRPSYRAEDAIPAFARACDWMRSNGVALQKP